MVRGKRREDPPTEKPKENGAAPPPKDHNQKPNLLLTDDGERSAYYFTSTNGVLGVIAEIEVLKEQIAGLKTTKKQWFKEIKARLGLNRSDIEYGFELRTDEDGKTKLEEARRRREIAVWEQHPVGTQIDFFETDRTPSVDRARAAGRKAGREGKPCDPPSHYGQAQSQTWMDGWHDGQADLTRSKLKTKEPLVDDGQASWPDDQQIQERTGEAGPATDPEPIGSAPSTAEQV